MTLAERETLKRWRTQMLLHSYLYYWLDDPIWTDDQWQAVANKLAALQASLEDTRIGYYDEAFTEWSGATGCHLPKDGEIPAKALAIYRLHKQFQ